MNVSPAQAIDCAGYVQSLRAYHPYLFSPSIQGSSGILSNPGSRFDSSRSGSFGQTPDSVHGATGECRRLAAPVLRVTAFRLRCPPIASIWFAEHPTTFLREPGLGGASDCIFEQWSHRHPRKTRNGHPAGPVCFTPETRTSAPQTRDAAWIRRTPSLANPDIRLLRQPSRPENPERRMMSPAS